MVTSSEIEQIKDRLPIEDVIREYGVQLQPAGRSFKGLCPFHQEKTPSFSVNPDGQYFYCFGCQEKGDLIAFVRKMESVGFPEAVDLLARRAGVAVTRNAYSGRGRAGGAGGAEAREGGASVAALYDALERARDHYHRLFLEAPAAAAAREYLLARGIERESWERFRLGFSPPDGRFLVTQLSREGVAPAVLVEAGLAASGGSAESRGTASRGTGSRETGLRDAFRGRLMFPIHNVGRRVIGFGARTLSSDDPRKYINTSTTRVFDKSRVLYGIAEGRQAIHQRGEIVLVEGYTDVIMAHQAGLENFVATLGTAFTEENARQLEHRGNRVWLVFDGDGAGQRAIERSLDLLAPRELDVRIFTVPGGEDPCEAIATVGAEAFRERMERDSLGLFEFKWRQTVAEAQSQGAGPSARGRALDECLALLARVPNAVTRVLQLREFAESLGLDERVVESRFREVARKVRPRGNAGPRGAQTLGAQTRGVEEEEGHTVETVSEKDIELARVVLECLIALPHRAEEMWAEVPRELFHSGGLAELGAAVEEQLSRGEFVAEHLAREIQGGQAQSCLFPVLSRAPTQGADSTVDEERWQRTREDLHRYRALREIGELTSRIQAAEQQGDEDSRRRLIRARFAARKKLTLAKGGRI